jgi:hypothetical protein
MSEHDQHLDDLRHIRGIMDRSTRFLSLSGLSGIWAGVVALAGAVAANRDHQALLFDGHVREYASAVNEVSPLWLDRVWKQHIDFLLLDAIIVLVVALIGAWWFTWRRSRATGQGLFDPSARRLMMNLLLPLGAGGIFSLALLFHGEALMVAPATLVFYGLALLNASKYTLEEVRWLGISEVALGLIAAFWLGAGLMFWALGFGVLHIIYGSLMWMRHERTTAAPTIS